MADAMTDGGNGTTLTCGSCAHYLRGVCTGFERTARVGPGDPACDRHVAADGSGQAVNGHLGIRGSGKTNTARVMAEEMFKAGLPFVVVDPVGAWWGLRSSRDGTGPGLPIPIFGGRHGDGHHNPPAPGSARA